MTEFFLCCYVAELRVIHHMSVGQGSYHIGIMAQREAHQRHEGCGLLDIIAGLSEDNEVALIALLLEIAERNGVGDTAVEQFSAFNLNHTRHQRHGGRSAYPFAQSVYWHILMGQTIDRLACFNIRANDIKVSFTRFERLEIKRVEFFR